MVGRVQYCCHNCIVLGRDTIRSWIPSCCWFHKQHSSSLQGIVQFCLVCWIRAWKFCVFHLDESIFIKVKIRVHSGTAKLMFSLSPSRDWRACEFFILAFHIDNRNTILNHSIGMYIGVGVAWLFMQITLHIHDPATHTHALKMNIRYPSG